MGKKGAYFLGMSVHVLLNIIISLILFNLSTKLVDKYFIKTVKLG
jgi:hypothetical protein